MNPLLKRFESSPLLARVAPFVVFVALTFLQGKLGPGSAYWMYLAKTVVGAWLVWQMWPLVAEMRWRFGWEAVGVGVTVFVLWVGLDGLYPSLNKLLSYVGIAESKEAAAHGWNPHAHFGEGAAMAWLLIGVRVLGSALVVPPLEEVFYRSFLYRYITRPDFQSVPLGRFGWVPFLVTSAVFGFAHYEWLAGILCGFAYQGLVCRKKRLGDAMTAHAITNFLLGVWVVWKGAWHFW